MTSGKSSLTHLECSRTGERHDTDRIQNLSTAGAPLLARYDLERAATTLTPARLQNRPFDLWRYREVLPPVARDDIFLGEGGTPLLAAPRLGQALGLSRLFIKDESTNPTGSFKARGMATAVSMAHRLGATALACPSAGNAGAALAAYAARVGLDAHIVAPRDAPRGALAQARAAGADVRLIDGLIGDAGRVIAEDCERHGWTDLSTLKEPYRIEGKKTMGYEIFEQLGRRLPDVIFYPTGGATGLIGMWKAFEEMQALGWVDSFRPRMVAVQATGCAPLLRAMEDGTDACRPWENARTRAPGLRVPKALGDFLALRVLRASKGRAAAVSDDALERGAATVTASEGVMCCPEGGACYQALAEDVAAGRVGADETVVLFNTASGALYAP